MTTHEAFIETVRGLALKRLDGKDRETLEHARLVYGVGGSRIERGSCIYGAWENGRKSDLIEICAAGEEHPVQLAGTTLHECAHVLAGWGAKHGKEWKVYCDRLGLRRAKVAQVYLLASLAPDIREYVASVTLGDGTPNFKGNGTAMLVPGHRRIGVCKTGRKAQKGRLRLWVCECPVKVRVASDDFQAQCLVCDSPFKRG